MTWTENFGVDITSAFLGITSPADELYAEIHGRGWTVDKVDFKNGTYTARAKNPDGETIEKTGPTDQTALGNLLTAVMRLEYMRTSAQKMGGMWSTSWADQLEPLAQAYAELPIYDPKAAPAWHELGQDSSRRAEALQQQLEVEPTHDPVPYKSAQEMYDDIHQNRHVLVSTANTEHPIWSREQAMAFNLVHNVLGHTVAGSQYDWHGQNRAVAAHMPLLGPNAQKALFTEKIGRPAFHTYYGQPAPIKIAFLDDHISPAQEKENPSDHWGVHPSLSIAPAQPPSIPQPEVVAKVANRELLDPNRGWRSGIDPLPDSAYLWHGDPLDSQGALDAATALHSDWKGLDPDSQRQAVMNAFRGALLAPRKPLDWNAIHYQGLMHLPATVTDPKRYWDALEHDRQAWNLSRGDQYSKVYEPILPTFYGMVKAHHPHLDDMEVRAKADRELFHMRLEEEERLLTEDPDRKQSTSDIEAKVDKALAKRLKLMTKPRIDQKVDFGHDRLFHDAAIDPFQHYEPFLANHCKTLAQLSHHADRLRDVANEDPGTGHHFRANVLSLGVPNVGAKEASFAWLMLHPMGSQLGVMDRHLMETLGHDYGDMNDRDYFKYERELAAGRDAAGYGHLPLGVFGWSLYDHKRTPGNHQDYSALRPVDPTPHDAFQAHTPMDVWQEPDWWTATQPYRDSVAKDWDRVIAINHPQHRVPFYSKTASPEDHIPVILHPDSGELVEGLRGQTIMQHAKGLLGVGTEALWDLNPHVWKR